jgi:hypothetical protein
MVLKYKTLRTPNILRRTLTANSLLYEKSNEVPVTLVTPTLLRFGPLVAAKTSALSCNLCPHATPISTPDILRPPGAVMADTSAREVQTLNVARFSLPKQKPMERRLRLTKSGALHLIREWWPVGMRQILHKKIGVV